jgi:hypothetical protein
MTTALPNSSGSPHGLEVSGSLTGHIMRQGRPDGPAPKRNIAKVGIVLVVGLVVLAAIGALVVLGVGDTFNSIFDGLIE